MKKIIVGAVIVFAAAYFLPWKNINWGKVTWEQGNTVTVTGEARTQQKNQIASFTAGVNSVNDKKETAVGEVNTKIEALIKAVKEFGVSQADIKTQNLSVYQNEEMYWDNGVQKSRKGQWRVDNSVEIILRNVDNANKLVDLLTSSGATNVYGPNFQMDDTNKIETGLFDEAIKNAREKAEAVAKSSGRKLGKVVTVTEGSSTSGIFPMYSSAKAVDGMGGASAETGSTTVTKSVTVVFELK